jgi:hypothetical protein
LAIIGSNANIKHIQILDSILNTLKTINYEFESMDDIDLPILDVGEMQSNYNRLLKAVMKFSHHNQDGNFITQSKLSNLRINQYSNLVDGAIRDKEISEKELEVAKKDLDRNKKLLDDGVIALQEYENKELAVSASYKSC